MSCSPIKKLPLVTVNVSVCLGASHEVTVPTASEVPPSIVSPATKVDESVRLPPPEYEVTRNFIGRDNMGAAVKR